MIPSQSPGETFNAALRRWPHLLPNLTGAPARKKPAAHACDWPAWWNAHAEAGVSPNLLLLGLDAPEQLGVAAGALGGTLRYICVAEPDAAHLRWVIEQPSSAEWVEHENVFILDSLDPEAVLKELRRRADSIGVNGLKVLTAPSWDTGSPASVNFLQRINSWADCERQIAQARFRQRGRPIANVLANIHRLPEADNLAAWRNRFAGTPAFLAGAGPSLDDNLETLKKAERYGLVIAADTALGSLLAAEIRPHFMATLDPTPENERHVARTGVPEETVVVWSGEVYRGVLDALAPGHPSILALDDENRLLQMIAGAIGLKAALPRTPQTGEMSFQLAAFLGCDPIVLVGYDLAFAADRSRTHAKGAALSRAIKQTGKEGKIEVTGVEGVTAPFESEVRKETGQAGEPIYLPTIFQIYRDRLEELTRLFPGSIIDAGGRGAKKKGMQRRPLPDVLAGLRPVADLSLRTAAITRDLRAQRGAILRQWLLRMRQSLTAALNRKEILNEALATWPSSEAQLDARTVSEAEKRMETAWKNLRDLDLYQELIAPCVLHLLLERLRVLPGLPAAEQSARSLQREREFAAQFEQTLRGFLTFAGHAEENLRRVGL